MLLQSELKYLCFDNMKTKNLTYLLGAGASYNSQPILSELADKMIALSDKHLPKKEEYKFETYEDNPFIPAQPEYDHDNYILWDVGYFGRKAKEFGTIDTYAKKLSLNNQSHELSRLKLALSSFFLLFQNIADKSFKTRFNSKGEILGDFEFIDKRYITLFSTILDNSSSYEPKLKSNIKFVTWNYDLQLQLTYQKFASQSKFSYIDSSFRYIPKYNQSLDVCHLNGFHGYFGYGGNGLDTPYQYIKGDTVADILKPFSKGAITNGGTLYVDVDTYINYAWETNNHFAEIIREQAISIFGNTDILVVIGYSFPTFNKEIDKLLFEKLKGREVKVYYQDPNATTFHIKHLSGLGDDNIECINKGLNYFFLPYEF